MAGKAVTSKAVTGRAGDTGTQTIAGVERTFEVLRLFQQSPGRDLGVTEVATELGLSKAVVHRVLNSLAGVEFITADPETRRYRLGVGALRLGTAYLEGIDALAVTREMLPGLVERTGETATVSVRSGRSRVYIAQSTPPTDIKMVVSIGSSHPLHAGGSSKALLAFMPEDFREQYLREVPLTRLTSQTVTDAGRLREELAQIRERGYSISLGERQDGAGSVAAPVLDHAGTPVVSMSVCGPVARFADEVEACAAALLETTARASHLLGH